jgi:hypothetical protein
MKTTNTEFKQNNPTFNTLEDAQSRYLANDTRGVYKPANVQEGKRPMERGRTAVWQARLVLLPLIIASGVCWLIALTIFLWWKPASRRHSSTGYIRGK